MKRTYTVFMILFAVLMLVTPLRAKAEPPSQKHSDYTELKGGYYYPSDRIHLRDFSGTDFDRRKGFDGEIAFGHHYVPFFGMEFGVGYIQDRRFAGTGDGRTKLEAVPVLLSAKLFLPLGPIEPYAEAGVGAYFTRFREEGAAGGTRYFRSVDVGPHVGAGLNINFTDSFYLGIEARYRRVRPEYGSDTVRLDGYTATANLGFRY